MEPENSQQPATGPYPEIEQSSPHIPTLFSSNIIIPYMHRSPEWSLLFMSSNQNSVHISRLSHACYMSRSSRSL